MARANNSSQEQHVDPFMRAANCAKAFCIGESTWWSWVRQGKVKPPVKLGARTSVWRSSYICQLQEELVSQAEG